MEQVVERPNIDWSEPYNQIVAGGLLGDGYMILRGRAKTPTYRETHGPKQRDYLLWKQNFLGGSVAEYSSFDRRTGKFYIQESLWVNNPRNVEIFRLFYKNGKKSVREECLKNLDPLSLLIFWLDDGSAKLHDGNGKLATVGFSRDENLAIIYQLERKFGIAGKLTPENEIFFNSKILPSFLELVHPEFVRYNLPDCMRYKMSFLEPSNNNLIDSYKDRRQNRDRERRRRLMSNERYRNRSNKLRRLAQARRLSNPEYRKRFNEYAKNWQRERRAREWLLKNGTKKSRPDR